MQNAKKSLVTNIILFAIYLVLSVVTYIVVGNFLHIFLIWNLFLATIPFGIVYLIDQKVLRGKVIITISVLLWLFFFPNSIYIITDLIYTDVYSLVVSGNGYQPTVYIQEIAPYMALFHIYLGSIIGLIYGFKSINALYNLNKTTVFYKYRDLLVIIVFNLSAVGIYIGRFFRYNSWDLFKIFNIINDFFSTFSLFTLFFIVALAIIQILIFYAFRYNFNQEK
ncbi:MAG: DUF1361 domain-containing protein [Tenericutes bacterium]|nr:DUF1361 domain-containing protein [Mycoplasmatota bacterium]